MKTETLMFPKAPPAGLVEYAESFAEAEHGLLYEAVWLPDVSLEALLTDTAGKKVKYVRCRCSSCHQETIMNWAPLGDPRIRYGFIDYEFDGVVGSGDVINCPACGASVRVRKAAELNRFGYFTTDETAVTSASVIGKNHNLVLSMWVIERRIYRDLTEKLVAKPAEAYVFSADDCQKYSARATVYGGNYGYKTAYLPYWKTAERWCESWGYEDKIFGLTPELVEQSCLPNCKLDVYMKTFEGTVHKYPVAYLRLYQAHPNVENLLLNGLPLALDEMIGSQTETAAWGQKNNRGTPALSGVNWNETRPAQMLGLTKEDLRQGQEMGWGEYFWRLYTGAKQHGEVLTRDTFETIHKLGEEHLLDLVGEAPVGKIVRYLRKQYDNAIYMSMDYEDEFGYPTDWGFPDGSMLGDYWRMCREIGRDLNDARVRFPKNLIDAHDEMSEAVRRWAQKEQMKSLQERFKKRFATLEQYCFEYESLFIIPARTPELLMDEANQQDHCVWSYADKHADGRSAIFFIRRTAAPDMSYFTLEFDEGRKTVRQNRGHHNRGRTKEVQEFEKLWLDWVRNGCRRDGDGKPILPGTQKVRVPA